MTRTWWLCGICAMAVALPLNAQENDDAPVGGPAVIESNDNAVATDDEASPEAPALPPAAADADTPAADTAPPDPAPVADEAAPAAAADDTVSARPALGVRFYRGTQVRIAQVLEDSPADRAGLLEDDLVVSLNGELPGSTDEFIALVAATPLDAATEVVVVRGGERHTLNIDLDAWNTVFTEPYTAARPDLDDDAKPPVVHYHAPYYYYAPYYYATNVSPVVVPASWYVPYPYPYPYYYTAAWGYWPSYYYNVYAPSYYAWPYYSYGPYYGYYPWTYPAVYGYPYPAHPAHDEGDDEAAPEPDSARGDLDDVLSLSAPLRN